MTNTEEQLPTTNVLISLAATVIALAVGIGIVLGVVSASQTASAPAALQPVVAEQSLAAPMSSAEIKETRPWMVSEATWNCLRDELRLTGFIDGKDALYPTRAELAFCKR